MAHDRRVSRPDAPRELEAAGRQEGAPVPVSLSSAGLARHASRLGEAAQSGLTPVRTSAPTAEDATLAQALARSVVHRRSLQREPGDGGTGVAQAPPAASLADRLIAGLEIYGPVNYDALIQDIQGASVAERRTALGNVRVRQLARDRLSTGTAVALMSSLLEGSQHWQNPPSNDFFDYFVTQKGTGTVPSTATMNCWEMILYSAYLVGAIGQPWIEQFYTDALAAPDPNVLIWQRLGWTAALPQYPAARPTDGQLLFYFTGGTYPGHVAISLGGDDAVSLWNQPRGEYATQRIRVDELAGTVYVGNPPW